MRWRLYIFILSVTAIFCFLLLTAVTDYGSGPSRRSPLVSAASSGASRLSSLIGPTPVPVALPSGLPESGRGAFDPLLKPDTPRLFVPGNADAVLARREAEIAGRTKKGGVPPGRLLKLDETGWHRTEWALVTAYCPCRKCCGPQAAGITSIGKNAWSAGLAADPEYLEYGTRVFVPGYGLSVIDDTGGAMRRHWRRHGLLHIDVRMTYHYEARQWGKQYMHVKIYDKD